MNTMLGILKPVPVVVAGRVWQIRPLSAKARSEYVAAVNRTRRLPPPARETRLQRVLLSLSLPDAPADLDALDCDTVSALADRAFGLSRLWQMPPAKLVRWPAAPGDMAAVEVDGVTVWLRSLVTHADLAAWESWMADDRVPGGMAGAVWLCARAMADPTGRQLFEDHGSVWALDGAAVESVGWRVLELNDL